MPQLEKPKRVLAVIPARAGSKSVTRKNLRRLGGKPLIGHAIETVKRSLHVDRVVLSTDDVEIMRIGMELGVEAPFRRPEDLATDHAPLIAVVLHAYGYFKAEGCQYDAVLSVQPTCPFLHEETIDRVIECWEQTNCESVVTVAEIVKGHPYISKRILPDRRLQDFCTIPEGAVLGPRQKREKAYYLTGGIYLRDMRLLEKAEPKGHCLGTDSRGVVVSEIEAVDINSELDLKFAEFLIHSGSTGK